MASIYFAAPLFCKAELDFNAYLADILRKNGHEVFLPQEGTNNLIYAKSEDAVKQAKKEIFDDDIKHIDEADVFLIILDGRVPDEGACFEFGYAYAKNKLCLGLKTDIRVSENGDDNIMLSVPLGDGLFRSIPELIMALEGM